MFFSYLHELLDNLMKFAAHSFDESYDHFSICFSKEIKLLLAKKLLSTCCLARGCVNN